MNKKTSSPPRTQESADHREADKKNEGATAHTRETKMKNTLRHTNTEGPEFIWRPGGVMTQVLWGS